MRIAFSAAIAQNYDYYIWLNDDTFLDPQAFAKLLDTYQDLANKGYPNAIVVGSTKSCVTGKPTYGGAVYSKEWYSNKLELLEPDQVTQRCNSMFGNCVLIPNSVVELVGNIDLAFIHSLGDLDYGLRAVKLGCSVWAVPGYVGICSQNSVEGSWVDMKLSWTERLRKTIHVKAFPLNSWTTFVRRHSGPFWFVYWPLPYLRAILGYRDLSNSPSFTNDEITNK